MDVEQIRSLVGMMVENDLSRIEIHEGQLHILLKRGTTQVVAAPQVHMAPVAHVQQAVAHAPAPAPAPAPAAAAPAAPAEDANAKVIRSPMVGTFYAQPDPDSPTFVKVGDSVGPESVVCLIEAMKVFNEIKADLSGRIARVLVQSGQAVEYDQPLFAVVPA